MTDIYEQHTAAFAKASAFVILDQAGERVATVAIKFPADGAGRLYAYVHLIGLPMARGFANGYGYDKRSAGVLSAIERIVFGDRFNAADPCHVRYANHLRALKGAMVAMGGDDWTRAIEREGYRVLQAV
jgi:hypothetical protein